MAVTTALKRRFSGKTPIVLLLALLLGSLYLMSGATENSEQFGRIYIPLLIINGMILLLLLGLIGVKLGRLVRQYRNHATGSRLTARLVVMFVVLAVTPVSVLYYFSLGFIRHGIDSWFDVRVEQVMSDALELSRTTLDWRLRDMMRQTEQMARSVSETGPQQQLNLLSTLRSQAGAREVAIVQPNGSISDFSNANPRQLTPTAIDATVLAQLKSGLAYVGLEPDKGSDKAPFARLVVSIPASSDNVTPRLLQAIFPVPPGIDALMERVRHASSQYEQLAFFSGPLKFSFTLTLSLVLLLSMFTAIWVAFYLAQRLVAPIRILAIGTRAVTEGDYHRQLPTTVAADDELGFLVKSFNTMMLRIALAQQEAERSRQNLEGQKGYLETVLGHLSSGVMTFSGEGRLLTANAAAEQILGVEFNSSIGTTLTEIGQAHEHSQAFVDMLLTQIGAAHEGWQEQVALYGASGRQMLMCRGVHLPARLVEKQEDAGYVVVFDDVTALLQAQRDAAWGEVARRIAHEIKNPLTPIRLSAERLRHKYLPTMNEEESQLLDRATHTIIQQVENMKELVNAFAEYARAPQLELLPLDLNALINEVLELYRSSPRPLLLEINLDPQIRQINADAGRIRQLIHNLVKNAIEAAEGDIHLKIETHQIAGEIPQVELSVTDSGPGIPDELIDKIFEPYVSTKPKGDGLGLAIVKKIVEEHNGTLWAENLNNGGVRFSVRLPLQLAHPPLQQQIDNNEVIG